MDLLPFLKTEKEFNHFIIGDIVNYDGTDNMDIFVGGTPEKPENVLLRYYSFFIGYAPEGMDFEEAAKVIEDYGKAAVLSGKSEFIDSIKRYLNPDSFEEREMHFAKLGKLRLPQTDLAIGVATVDDAGGILDLLSKISEFPSRNEDDFVSSMEKKSSRRYFISENGEFVATASTSVETEDMAMIVAVATHPDHRGKGLATAVTGKLCLDLRTEGKDVCLFYDNPDAGRIYRKMGFEDMGKWKMLDFSKH